jgi:hypothetical protein
LVPGNAWAYNQALPIPVPLERAEREIVTSVATLDADFLSALGEAVDVLRSVAEYDLEHELQQRMRALGENKEACSPNEREEHRQLAEFWRRQTLRKVRAFNALKRLRQTAPELVGSLPNVPEQA